jgi:AraC family transcriptional regulator, transcriptional activator of pobA
LGKKSENISQPLDPRDLNVLHFGDKVIEEFQTSDTAFHINKIEDIRSFLKFPLQPHRKTVYDFLFLTNGHSTRTKNLTSYEFSSNHFFFLPALQISSHELMSEDTEGYYCHFHPELFNSISAKSSIIDQFSFYNTSASPVVEIAQNHKNRFINILQRLLEEFSSNKLANKKIIASYLSTLLYEIDAIEEKSTAYTISSSQKITEKYKDLLSQNIYKNNKVAQYAAMMSITPDHLNKSVKASLGFTAQELLSQMMILEAKILLKQTTLNAAEIADKFCESNPSDFARFFKKQTGIAPIEYRKISKLKD